MKIKFDSLVESVSRGAARRYSRRNMISLLGRSLLGGMALPLLPINRLARAEETWKSVEESGWSDDHIQTSDPLKCNYWAYCAQGGYLCAGCGGAAENNTCPPGTEPSASAWVGTCYNPDDKKHYLIAYRDCCGNKGSCQGEISCENRKGEKPPYMQQLNDDTIWCFGTNTMMYSCSGAVVIGEA